MFYYGGITLRVWLLFNLLSPPPLPCLVQYGQDCLWGVQVGLEECLVLLERHCSLWGGTLASCILLCLPLFVDSATHCAPMGHRLKVLRHPSQVRLELFHQCQVV